MCNRRQIERHTISVLVDNEAGVLARVIGLFSGRGYNIESLTVAEVDAQQHLSRITVVTSARRWSSSRSRTSSAAWCRCIRSPTSPSKGPSLERELALVKVKGTGEKRVEVPAHRRHLPRPRGRFDDQSFVFEMTGSTEKLDAFINLMQPLGLVDVSRTGVVAIARGPEAL